MIKTTAHVPIRTCIGCSRRDRQSDMLRVVCDSGRGLAVDTGDGRTGRGGYLHRDEDCWVRFASRKGMVRSLGISVDRSTRGVLVDQLRSRLGQ